MSAAKTQAVSQAHLAVVSMWIIIIVDLSLEGSVSKLYVIVFSVFLGSN